MFYCSGKITKVINMKPQELLGLVEEASGTRLYQLKRENAIKLVLKKEQKLQEIANILDEDIYPNIQRLEKEKNDFLRFVSLKDTLLHYQRYETAYRYFWYLFIYLFILF